ncbi:MAG: thymidylate synthase [Candidatus Yonathbacteria bacterium RIFCSPLOWO2_01_FULL_43_27]|uniref:Thymidylate synthase n=2 Tax=Parcubacteria group TaxID=1794811 RepID=A0A1G2SCF5_9BACT|nr:MAG: Thymidylate synthase [Candidatus Azambacteria bacterium GW2011_GWA1_44_9]OHA82703.1 MAG: thymidylate synthase [Candidatus Yonathbacteria bacterium RIFCSPLOWO2_01_FULL_43_27]
MGHEPKDVIAYLPLEKRVVDTQYHDLLRQIYEDGETVRPIHGGESRMIAGAQMRFTMANGFPVITERDLSGNLFYGALAEHIAFLHGAHTLEELRAWGVNDCWWAPWVTKEKCEFFGLREGELGSASYGEAWTRFPIRDGGTFNQITAVIDQIKRMPFLRTHRITSWYPPEIIGPPGTRRVVVAPCHGDIYINMFPEKKELIIHHVQRSGDLPVGVAFNLVQYAAFGMMLAKILEYTFTELVYTFNDVHLYEMQYPHVEELLAREPFPFPTVTLSKDADDIMAFRPRDFTLKDYVSHPKMTIPTPI